MTDEPLPDQLQPDQLQPDGLLVRPFETVLVANRGEIAVRVLRSARAAGYATVAVHSDADSGSPHVLLADTAVRIGPAVARDSYLHIGAVVAAAVRVGADAVHPGYGFLAENAAFARACTEAGLVFIGPPPHAIDTMGDKAAAKRLVGAAGVPLLPGYEGESQDDASLIAAADTVGYPLMVKAAAGGGGKGMRLVAEPSDLPEALAAARREAGAAFGSTALLLERALSRPRHVEVQVLADAHGHVISLGDRDCSVQRRHQKVVEEAPAPGLLPEVRAGMADAAVAAATSVGYVGAGTVEFLLDEDGRTFSFLEMNTRLQVEHPVTEAVTGLDLVDWQLRIASGAPLDLAQDDVTTTGHAIEVRLYAEDPEVGHLPQTGTIERWDAPEGPGIRVDAGIAEGSIVTAHYDPLLAKVIAHGRDRDEAVRRLRRALERTVLLGLRSNRTFLSRVLAHPEFATGAVSTAFLSDHALPGPVPTERDVAAVAGWLHLAREADAARRTPGLAGWSSSGRRRSHQRIAVGDALWDVLVERDVSGLRVRVTSGDGDPALHRVRGTTDGVAIDDVAVSLSAVRAGPDRVLARLPWIDIDAVDVLLRPATAAGTASAGVLRAPMHGAVVAVHVEVGDLVRSGDPLVVVEAMKMEHVVVSDVDGTVGEVVAVGRQVALDEVLARVTGMTGG